MVELECTPLISTKRIQERVELSKYPSKYPLTVNSKFQNAAEALSNVW